MAIAAKRTKTIMARRQDLIQGTIQSIATLGYNNSTVQSICDAAGLSRGLIGHYFKGKDDLLLEAFRHLVSDAEENTRQAIRAVGTDPLQRLLAASSAAFSRAQAEGDKEFNSSLVWLACWGVSPWVPEMKALQSKLWRRYRHWVERMFAQAAEERGLKIDARRAAIMYSELINGLWIGWLLDNEAYSPETAAGIVSDWLLDFFGERNRMRQAPSGKAAATRTKAKAPAKKRAGRKG